MSKILYAWEIYIPEEGHWPIKGMHENKAEARIAYLRWANRKRLPAGSYIYSEVFIKDNQKKELKKLKGSIH